MSNVFITGGEIFYNKGAQSMSFIAVDQLSDILPKSTVYLMSNIDKKRPAEERSRYTFNINRSLDVWDALYKHPLLYFFARLIKKHNKNSIIETHQLLLNSSAIIDISGYAMSSDWPFYRALSIAVLCHIGKKYNLDVYIMPQSFGPFDFKGIKKFIFNFICKHTLPYAKVIYAREREGYELLTKKIKLKNVVLSNDLVLCNKGINIENIYKKIPELNIDSIEKNSVAIIPNMKNFEHGGASKSADLYVFIVNTLLNLGKNIYLMTHSTEDIEACELIKKDFAGENRVILLRSEYSCFEYDKMVTGFDFIIASRYHSIVHAYKKGIPCFVVGWALKYKELLEKFKQEKYMYNIRNDIDKENVVESLTYINEHFKEESDVINQILKDIQKENVFDVIKREPKKNVFDYSDICSSCGICSAVCPKKCIEYSREGGRYIPSVDSDKCSGCGLCTKICSADKIDYPMLYETAGQSYPEDLFVGNHIKCHNCFALDDKLRKSSSSGGIVTLLIKTLLEKKLYNSAFCVDIYDYSEHVSTGRFTAESDFDSTPKSRYIPISHAKLVKYMLENRDERVIITAVSCVYYSILRVIEHYKLNRENYLFLGLFCEGTLSYSVYNYLCDIAGKGTGDLFFKSKDVKGWPGDVKISYKDGSVVFFDKEERMRSKDYFKLEKCHYCLDKLNQFADISLGDNYTGKNGVPGDLGSSSVIIRTQRGSTAFDSILPFAETFDIGIDDIIKSQHISERAENAIYAKLSGKIWHIGNNIKEPKCDLKKMKKKYRSKLNKMKKGNMYLSNKKAVLSDISRVKIKREIIRYIKALRRKILDK